MLNIMRYLQQTQPELAEQIKQFQRQKEGSANPVVTAIGLYNTGKSTLFNVLTDNLDHEFFKTARIRETRNLKKLTFSGVDYQDTPGLDAEQQDDKTAFEAIATSDLLLLCHSTSIGELDQPTLDYLQRIQQQGGQPLSERLICVLTKAEDNAKSRGAQALVSQQLQQLTGQKPVVFCVSSASYKRGMTEGKQLLVRDSGIPELKTYLKRTLDQQRHQLQRIRVQRRQWQMRQLIAKIEMERQRQQQDFNRQHATVQQKFAVVSKALERSRKRLREL